MNIHLVRDEKFIPDAIAKFDKYYNSDNIYIVDKEEKEALHVTFSESVYFLPFQKFNFNEISQLISTETRLNILVHYLSKPASEIAIWLKGMNSSNRLFWIFYGSDLYRYLAVYEGYKLYDYMPDKILLFLKDKLRKFLISPQYLKNFCSVLDFFCFWNPYDYRLLQKYLKTNAEYRNFFYGGAGVCTCQQTVDNIDCSILLNHSASLTGNHITLLDKLRKIDKDGHIKKIIMPLSYGSLKYRKKIINYGSKIFPGICDGIVDFLPKSEYFEMINDVQFAIMGHKRQEAGGNIWFLLLNGKKVFLRETNSLLMFYKEKGCYVFSFENELNSIDDLKPLSTLQKQINYKIITSLFSLNAEEKMMRELLN